MSRERSYSQVRVCEECGQPIEHGYGNQLLCRRCEEAMERSKRRGQKTRQSRRNSRRNKDEYW